MAFIKEIEKGNKGTDKRKFSWHNEMPETMLAEVIYFFSGKMLIFNLFI